MKSSLIAVIQQVEGGKNADEGHGAKANPNVGRCTGILPNARNAFK
jgi:hypothetical protein